MGNNFSKKNQEHTMSNYHELFSSHKSLFENKIDYDEREHLSTSLLREIFKGNYSSPIQDILGDSNARILDVGCGSGFWLTEMAADYQKPKFIGIEMLSIFPKSTFPSNVEFVKRNLLDGLNKIDTFDFIHLQFLGCDFTESQWENFIFQELARVLKPGGWLEVCDCEFVFKNYGPKSGHLSKAVNEYLISKDVNPNIILRQGSLIKSIPSFSSSNIHHKVCQLPLSSQLSNIGKFGADYVKEHCRSFLRGPVGQHMNIERKNIDSTINEIGREFDLYGTYLNYHRFYVQKQR